MCEFVTVCVYLRLRRRGEGGGSMEAAAVQTAYIRADKINKLKTNLYILLLMNQMLPTTSLVLSCTGFTLLRV